MRISDWSSDVCSSDLPRVGTDARGPSALGRGLDWIARMLRHRKIEPGVAMLGPYRLFGHRKVAIGKSPRRDADQVREPFGVPPQRRSAVGAEMEGHVAAASRRALERRSEEHTSELQSLM